MPVAKRKINQPGVRRQFGAGFMVKLDEKAILWRPNGERLLFSNRAVIAVGRGTFN
jgi:hypothetical protein